MEQEKEKLLEKAYGEWLDLILYDFPIERIDEIVVEDVKGYGSTQDEKFLEIHRLRKMVTDQREQGANFKINYLLTPIHRRISPQEDTVIYTDEFEITMENEETKQIIPLRVSTVFEFNHDSWKLVHLHGSTGVETEEDTWHLSEWQKKNEELQRLVDEKTIELTKKNRELEIEASLERIRARTMAMQKSGELKEIIQLVYDQFVHLNIQIEHTGFIIDYKERDDLHIWLADQHMVPSEITIPCFDSPPNNKIREAKEKGKDFFKYLLPFEEKNKFYQDLFKFIPDMPEESLAYYFNCQGLAGSGVLLDNVGLYIENFDGIPYSDEDNNTLMSIGKVFQQTYTRFLDLQKAEAQAREALLEAALERVRAKAMAMHNSENLNEVVATVFAELKKLNIGVLRCGVGIFNREQRTGDVWSTSLSGADTSLQVSGNESFDIHPLLSGTFDAWLGQTDFSYTLEGKDLAAYYNALTDAKFELPNYQQTNSKKNKSKQYYYTPTFQAGNLYAFSETPFTDEAKYVLQRFALVLNLTYNRFLDLKKAEEQAREAQIQLSLERVRARSLAMQSSDELHEVLSVLFRQFDDLGIKPVNVFLSLFDMDKRTFTYRASGKSGKRIPGKQVIEVDSMELLKALYNKWLTDNSDTVEVIYYPKEVLPELFGIFAETFSAMPEDDRMGVDDYPNGGYSMAGYTPFGYLGYDHQRQATEEEKEILSRFCIEFSRVYQRFLDIQKAEKQAREAQIEAALEKVRSRSLAMHKSDELIEIIVEVQRRFQELDISMQSRVAVVVVFDKNSKNFNQWVASPDFSNIYISTPYFQNPILDDFWTAKERGIDFYSKAYSFEVKNSYFKFFFENSIYENVDGLEEQKKWLFEQEFYSYSPAFEKNSSIGIADFSGKTLNESDIEIIKRFAKVFEQAYVRFLDLQKAEAQAREAQIEAALERVRSRTMAMHKSEELTDVSAELFKELKRLRVNLTGCGFGLCNLEKDYVEHWMHVESGLLPMVKVPIDLDHVHMSMYNSWRKKKPYTVELVGDELKQHYEKMAKITQLNQAIEKMKETKASLPDYQKNYVTPFKYGYVIVATIEDFPEEHIFTRFTKVFEQAYTRFLDLQKAEAQAREAQIEAALEKIRNRTLLMRDSSELNDAVAVFFEQFKLLELLPANVRTYFSHVNTTIDTVEVWMTHADGTVMSGSHITPLTTSPQLKNFYHKWKKNKEIINVRIYKDQDLVDYINFLTTLPHVAKDEDYQKLFNTPPDKIVMTDAGFAQGFLGIMSFEPLKQEAIDLLARFAKVFEFTYTRFLDLQKAEAQAREAKIEAALERVRAAGMAMHKSNDLAEASTILFEQLVGLGVKARRVGFALPNDEKEEFTVWSTIRDEKGKASLLSAFFYYDQHPIYPKMIKHWHAGNKFFSAELHGKDVQDYYKSWNKSFKPSKALLKSVKKNTSEYYQFAYFKQGIIYVFTAQPLSEEQHQLISRFAKAFELTYTRFLDLQKAEAQAREAEIQLALERVRAGTMAMHKSEELSDTASIMFQELKKLGINSIRTGVCMFNHEEDSAELWLATQDEDKIETKVLGKIDGDMHPMYREWIKAHASKKKMYQHKLSGNEIPEYYEKVSAHLNLPKQIAYNQTEIYNGFFFTEGSINIISTQPLTEEECDIGHRFANVFGLLYRRFLDLKKAEAQARDAQIEAALERVRAKSLAMHKSQDLHGVVTLVYEQLEAIGLFMNSVLLHEINSDNKNLHFWVAANGQVYPNQTHLPVARNVFFTKFRQAQKNKESFFNLSVTKRQKDSFFTHYFQNSNHSDVPQKRRDFIFSCKGLNISTALQEHTALTIMRYDKTPYDKEQNEVIKRFAQVFEQSYNRFLDLQKAEAQAREAQIQLALERVRARTMAMHKSDELPETSHILFEQMNELGEPSDQLTIGIVREDINAIEISATLHGNTLKKIYNHSIDEPYMMNKVYKAWKMHQKTLIVELKGKELNAYNQYRNELTNSKMFPTNLGKEHQRIVYAAFFSKGMLALGTNESRPTQSLELLERFASVFDLTYTRFLDLQKAEAQAREAEIELALERVRAKSMAMHASNEIQDVVNVVFNNLMSLGIVADSATILIPQPGSKDFDIWIQNSENNYSTRLILPYYDTVIGNDFIKAFKAKGKILNRNYSKEEKDKMFDLLFKHPDSLMNLPKKRKEYVIEGPSYSVSVIFNHNTGIYIGRYNDEMFSDIENNILMRFSKVFEQAYTRFLDLQKAEAQAREAQIEAALEGIRARSMAMHKSGELREVMLTVLSKLEELGISMENRSTGIFTFEAGSKDYYQWAASPEYKSIISFLTPYFDHPVQNDIWNARQIGLDFYTKSYTVQEKNSLFKFFFEHTILKDMLPEEDKVKALSFDYYNVNIAFGGNSAIALVNHSNKSLINDEIDILNRFSKVFEQSYTRFLDLQKAEAQAKEAQIEASLERVRSKALAMHNSADLSSAASVVFTELRKLGVNPIRSGVGLLNDRSRKAQLYSATSSESGDNLSLVGWVQLNNHPVLEKIYESWLQQDDYFPELEGEQMRIYYQLLLKGFSIPIPDFKKEQKQFGHFIPFSVGCLYAWSDQHFSEDQLKIFRRFASIVDLTFRRYFDLVKAENQAREAQIEASLERVRSKAMAMHNSADLSSAASVVFSELKGLGINTIRSGVGLLTKESRKVTLYSAASSEQGDNLPLVGWAMLENHPVLSEMYDKWLINEDYFPILKGNLLKTYYKEIKSNFVVPPKQEEDYEQHGYFICFTHGLFYGWAEKPFTDGEKNILKRFASVVDLTFKRYFDLKSAEAQAREAKIEASLERVRAKAMAMHTSEAVGGAISVMFQELENLGIKPIRCGIFIISENKTLQAWTTSTDGSDQAVNISGNLDMTIHPLLEGCFEHWKSGKNLFQYLLEGQDAIDYYTAISSSPEYILPVQSVPKGKHFASAFLFKEGGLFSLTQDPVTSDEQVIYQRFTNVFTLTYRRYQDLKAAELRALEAVKQSSLDRVRGEIASMRTSEDLNRITPVIWRELQALEVPFFRCGVFIVNEKDEHVHAYLTTPDGKPLGVLSLQIEDNDLTTNIVNSWRKKRIYKTHWDKTEFINWTKNWMDKGQIKSAETYQGSSTAPESLYLHFVPFKQGMLYVGDVAPLTDDKLELVKTLSESFSIAYSRYEDFVNLEEAKNKTEVTLNELKAAQNQLVQSEKMASLGELTAGIAHEIQNPLNFVNNFSEVSKELIEEMMEELKKGDTEEVEALAKDIIENLEKITHHGKRADGIVKGMLQHSRTSTGIKEPTNINVLADEYLRLAYHGLRAKDKTFNATMNTDFDESIGKINVISQDIGRVILNLITNAFYAVTEKKKQLKDIVPDQKYEPSVLVSTKKLGNTLEISVKDNGNGIPKKLIEKIFQPFFSTKPTGQGTGLGLSLSYDIIKAHGGEIKVESKENEGTEFKILLFLN